MRDNQTVKPGRPRLGPEERRSARVVTMVTASQYATLQELAQSRCTTLSTLCHDLLVTAIDAPPLRPRRPRNT